jgi:hypothetical protein
MSISFFHRCLTEPIHKIFSPRSLFWLSLSLIFSAIFGTLALQEAFSGDYVIQDDARQHVTWLLRFWDAELFPKDMIADYYLSSLPLGYTSLYRLLATFGIDPILASKLLPIALGLLTTGYGFALALEMLPVPTVGFMATVFLNQMLWNTPILVSSTPRAFAALFFLAFLYYLLQRSLFPCLAAIALQGLFYPPYILMIAGILVLKLLRWEKGWPRLSLEKNNYLLCGAGLGVALLVLLPYVLSPSEYGPTITAAQAKMLSEFQPGGRTAFFGNNFWNFWFFRGKRSSLQIHLIFNSPILWAGLLLPLLLRYPARFPLTRRVNSEVIILWQMLLVSLGLFLVAHAVLFALYLPSRYAQGIDYAIRFSTSIAVVVILDALILRCRAWVNHRDNQNFPLASKRQFLAQGIVAVLAGIILLYPSSLLTPKNWYVYGSEPQLYAFLSQQPKDTLTASLAYEASNLPSFAKRSVLVSPEFAIPYEIGYYKLFRSRSLDLIEAQYSYNLEPIRAFIKKHGVDFWLLEQDSFTLDYLRKNSWLKPFQPAFNEALKKLERGDAPALTKIGERCSVFENERVRLLDAKCILKS